MIYPVLLHQLISPAIIQRLLATFGSNRIRKTNSIVRRAAHTMINGQTRKRAFNLVLQKVSFVNLSLFSTFVSIRATKSFEKIETVFQLFWYSQCTTIRILKYLSLCRLRQKASVIHHKLLQCSNFIIRCT